MKLEMGEFLAFSWLKHVKGCHVVQMNWKNLFISLLALLLAVPSISEAQISKLDRRSEASINLNMEDSRNYPNIKEAISELMKFENDESSQMFKPIVCINQDKGLGWKYRQTLLNSGGEIVYSGDEYIITVDGKMTGSDWIVINTFNIWDSKTFQYIKSLACIVPRAPKSFVYDKDNHRFAVEMCEPHGYTVSFAYDIVSDTLEHFAYITDEAYEDGSFRDYKFRNKIFKNLEFKEGVENSVRKDIDVEVSCLINKEKTDILHRMDFSTLKMKPKMDSASDKKQSNISIMDINGDVDASMKMIDPIQNGGIEYDGDSGYRLLFPKSYKAFYETRNTKVEEKGKIKFYDVRKKKLYPISPSLVGSTEAIRTYGGESDCNKDFYIHSFVEHFHGEQIRWSDPELYNKTTGDWEIITSKGKRLATHNNEAEEKREVAYDIIADVPIGIGSRLSVWNKVKNEKNFSYWIAASDGYCGLFLMDDVSKTGKLVQSWTGAWKDMPKPVYISEKNWLCLPVEEFGWEVYEIKDFSKPIEKKFDIFVGNNDAWVIMLPNGYYTCSPGGEDLITYNDEKGERNMKALSMWYNRPAEVLKYLGGNKEDVEVLHETTKRWLAKKGFCIDNMPNKPCPTDLPKVEAEKLPLNTMAERQVFKVTLTAGKNALTDLLVRVNGVVEYQKWSKQIHVVPNGKKILDVSVELSSGQNFVELTPIDSLGIEGDVVKFRMVRNTGKTSKLYVIGLGVSDYDDDELDLQFAAKDAKDLVNAFEKYGKGEVIGLSLLNKDVTDLSVLKKVETFLQDTKKEDRIVFYLAGHGMLDEKLDYYYAPSRFDVEKMSETGISMDSLVKVLQGIPARERILILDTCHSGVLGEEGEEKMASTEVQLPQGVRMVQTRGMKVRKAIGGLKTRNQKKRYIEEMFAIDKIRGINIIAGASGAEYALESGEWNNGVFTASLIRHLKNFPNNDKNLEGNLTLRELFYGLQSQVFQQTCGAQNPNLVALETPSTILTSCISAYVANSDWDSLCKLIRNASERRDILKVLDTFRIIKYPHRATKEENIRKLELKGRKYSKEDYGKLRNEAKVIAKLRPNYKGYDDRIQIPCRIWECALRVGITREDLIEYKDVWEDNKDASSILRMLNNKPGMESNEEKIIVSKHDDLLMLIDNLKATKYSNATYRLYQKRLLAVLPLIAQGGHIDTNVDTVRKKSNGTTALHNACGLAHYEIVKWLLDHGASLKVRATNGVTPEQCVGNDNDPSGKVRKLIRQYK